ncbi:MAG TPA: class I SAM-dependent methyltransferase [Candidatus Acidoferrales bacterium]|jgi:ubiquinone/menaquinone biosynthesis C-methylase UbiE|nr:class I SAM-dependent methyltransferase [Candidatus Acidoferrales bacterium]
MNFSQQVRKIIAPLHRRYRTQKLNCFFQALHPESGETLLDVGGGFGIVGEFEPLYSYFRTVHIVNLDPQQISDEEYSHVKILKADGCALPFSDKSYDWIFSNAVIEHVGGAARQQLFASEIRRVARKGYFVATPNRNFPVDPHTLLPFYQFLSPQIQRKVCRFSPGYIREYEPIDLLSARDLQTLFPGAVILKMGMRMVPNNLVAYRSFADS